jgi:hypothetical protein
MSRIDVLLLERRLRLVRNDLEMNAICMNNARAHFDKDVAKLNGRRDSLEREERQLLDDLYWLRLHELVQTPCWRYRVAA